ncbi:10055_t:CDS:2 [Funneliformis geosporum]|nr:10055_t:CDS:2 [Funneliformis geosporum]
MQSIRERAYDNWKVYSLGGELMFRCNTKKISWYLSRNLANQIADDSIQLNFQPKGLGHIFDKYHLEDRCNFCVCCGDNENLTRHHVVPEMYRRQMPEVVKSHTNHDILLMCIKCHTSYEKAASELKKKIAKDFDMPLNGRGRVRLDYNVKVKKVASALNKTGIPEDRMRELRNILFTWQQTTNKVKSDKLDDLIEQALMLPEYEKTNEFIEHGEYIVSQLLKDSYYVTGSEDISSTRERWPKLEEFIYLWRDHFVKTTNPQFLSKHWKVIDTQNLCNSKSQHEKLIPAEWFRYYGYLTNGGILEQDHVLLSKKILLAPSAHQTCAEDGLESPQIGMVGNTKHHSDGMGSNMQEGKGFDIIR